MTIKRKPISATQKAIILQEAKESSIAEVAKRHNIGESTIHSWKRTAKPPSVAWCVEGDNLVFRVPLKQVSKVILQGAGLL